MAARRHLPRPEFLERNARVFAVCDDGVHSAGIKHLAIALAELADVVVVAPGKKIASPSFSLSVDAASVREEHWADSDADLAPAARARIRVFSVSGTPLECVAVAWGHIFPDVVDWKAGPDLIVSGINAGHSLGSGLPMSGTVAGAVAAAAIGRVPAVALSALPVRLQRDQVTSKPPINFEPAARIARALVQYLLSERAPRFEHPTVLNVNTPYECETVDDSKRLLTCITTPSGISKPFALDPIQSPQLHEGSRTFHVLRPTDFAAPGSDTFATEQRCVSITALHVDSSMLFSPCVDLAYELLGTNPIPELFLHEEFSEPPSEPPPEPRSSSLPVEARPRDWKSLFLAGAVGALVAALGGSLWGRPPLLWDAQQPAAAAPPRGLPRGSSDVAASSTSSAPNRL